MNNNKKVLAEAAFLCGEILESILIKKIEIHVLWSCLNFLSSFEKENSKLVEVVGKSAIFKKKRFFVL